jgi:hypothetical protein
LAAALEKHRNARGRFHLNEQEMQCFNAFKELIAKAPILYFPDFSLIFFVATDASNMGIAAVLYQSPKGEFVPGKTKYISFQSGALHDHEKKLSCIQERSY